MEKMTIRECMEDRITFLKNRLQGDHALLADTADITHVADTLRRLNRKAEKRARDVCWSSNLGKHDQYRLAALDFEV